MKLSAIQRVMGRCALLSICLVAAALGSSQSLEIRLLKEWAQPGDTVAFQAVWAQPEGRKAPAWATLHVWIEDSLRGRSWRLRYPMADGYSEAEWVMPSNLPGGHYRLHFQVQRELVHLMGQVVQKKPPRQINCMAVAGNQDVLAQTIAVDDAGYFQLPNLLFEGRATFVFSPVQRSGPNRLDVELRTPVDSAFRPVVAAERVLRVEAVGAADATVDAAWQRDAEGTLESVTVRGKATTELEKFMREYVSGFFEGPGYTFDGLGDGLLSAAPTVLDFLMGKVPGLEIHQQRDSGELLLHWRGFEPALFLDEMPTDLTMLQSVNTADIALVRVLRPPFYGVPMGSAGGAIAVYTKKGQGSGQSFGRNRFVVSGYTPSPYVLVL